MSDKRPMMQALEARRLMAFEEWGDPERLIRLPDAIAAAGTASLDGAGQTIAVIDSGIDYTHPALGGGFGPGFKVVGGRDFVSNDNDPMDTFGHGTEVAGILAADQYMADGLRHRGMAPAAKLVALRIDGNGTSSVPDSRIESALQWVIEHRTDADFGPNGITVVNISYGTGSFNEATVSTVYGDEIQALFDAGVVIVASSGNEGVEDGPGTDTPAADPNVISVGSVDTQDHISDFTERGLPLSLLAPGEFVYTSLRLGGFGVVDGTSFAAPFVAGTVALMRAADLALAPADIRSILSASSISNFDGDVETQPFTRMTFGRLDVLSALTLTAARSAGSPAEQALLGKFGNGNTLALDEFGVTHFAYYDAQAKTMRYATRSTSGVWSKLQVIDNTLPFQGYYLSMAVDSFGRPGVAYFDGTNGDLEFASYNGIQWTSQSIDIKNSTGLYPSLVFDRADLPIISYYRKTSGDLRVARRQPNQTWAIDSVDIVGDVGRDTSIAMDGAGRFGVGYADSGNGFLKYALFQPKTQAWASTVVDNTTRGVSFLSMEFDRLNGPLISYYDSDPADLKVARLVSRRWRTERVASRGATGLFSTLFINNDDVVNTIFYDKRVNGLQIGVRTDTGWQFRSLKTNAGRFATTVYDPFLAIARYTYLDSSDGKVKIDQVQV